MRKTLVLLCGKPDALELHSDKMGVLQNYIGVSHTDSHSLKTLGVQVGQKFSFKTMVSDACRAGYLKLEQLKRLRHVLSQQLKTTMVKCFVLLRVNHCNALYCNFNGQQTRNLQKLVNNSIMFKYCLRKTQSTSEFAIRWVSYSSCETPNTVQIRSYSLQNYYWGGSFLSMKHGAHSTASGGQPAFCI